MTQVPAVRDVLTDIARNPSLAQFPPRVLESIRRQENTGEILVKLIQLTVVGIWSALYFAAPKAETMFAPVPLALGVYLVLNLIGLAWVLRSGLPDWAVYVNVLIDVAVLMLLIWSFHIQYEQPPSFYLKAPTLLYVFVFIAVRALRFQARFVVAAGVTAALGWLVMTLYVLNYDPATEVVTKDYIQYLTGNALLLGAEVDKIIVILLVSIIIALALRRGRLLLIEAVSQGTAARDLSRFFDEGVARQIRSSDHAVESGEGVRRDAAILFVDIRGFSTLSARLDAREVVNILTAYEKRIVPIIQANGGTIDKFLGDGIMASFGAVAESETYAADALRTIDGIVAETANWSSVEAFAKLAPGAVNMAVASGPVVFGALGGDNRLEFTVIGASVNLAAKLEKHNKAMDAHALTDLKTLQTAETQGYNSPSPVQPVNQAVEGHTGDLAVVKLYPA